MGESCIGSTAAKRAARRTMKKVETSWDQFEANERFDENLYTTRLDNSLLTKQQVLDAERLAAENSNRSSRNVHVHEEINMMTKMDDIMGEEDCFRGVLGTSGLAHTTLNNGGGGNGLRQPCPRNRSVPFSMASSAGKTNAVGSETGAYVSPALRPPCAPVHAGVVSTMGSTSMEGVNERQMTSTAAEAWLEEAKAALMDILGLKHRSTPPPKNDNRSKPEVASSHTVILERTTTAPSLSPKKATPVAETPPVPEPASRPSVGDGEVSANSAEEVAKRTVSSSDPPFIPAIASAQATRVTSHPPCAARVTKTGGVGAKKKSTLRASAKEWKPGSMMAAEAGPGVRTCVGSSAAAPVAIEAHIPTPTQAMAHQQSPSPTQAPVVCMMTSSPRGGGDTGFGTGGRGVISRGAMGFSGGVEHVGDYGHVPHMHQNRTPPQHKYHNRYIHHTVGSPNEEHPQQKQQTSPHPSRQSSPQASPYSSRSRQGHVFQQQQQQQQPHLQNGSSQQESTQRHSGQQQQQQPRLQNGSSQQESTQQHSIQPQQQQQHLPAAGLPTIQGMPPYPPGSMPSPGTVRPGVVVPPHMAGVPPYPLVWLLPGQVHPQLLYRTPMGHNPQSMFMHMPIASGHLQGFPQQGMPMMTQPGAPGAPPGSPFYHGNIQPQQQQQSQMQLLPPQITAQQGHQPSRGFMVQGHSGARPASGYSYTPSQPQRPGGAVGMTGMGGGVNGGRGGATARTKTEGTCHRATTVSAAPLEETGGCVATGYPAKIAHHANTGVAGWQHELNMGLSHYVVR